MPRNQQRPKCEKVLQIRRHNAMDLRVKPPGVRGCVSIQCPTHVYQTLLTRAAWPVTHLPPGHATSCPSILSPELYGQGKLLVYHAAVSLGCVRTRLWQCHVCISRHEMLREDMHNPEHERKHERHMNAFRTQRGTHQDHHRVRCNS